jgi:hypothetical protein
MSTASGTTAPLAPVEEVSAEQKEFLAEIEVMDLTPIKGKTYMVAVGTGDPNKIKFLCSDCSWSLHLRRDVPGSW